MNTVVDKKYDCLKLDNQLCFPLYACAREIIKKYRPFLDEIDLTYTQYVAMMVMWEYGTVTSKELGEKLYLDSGTLTPLLKKMEEKNLIKRQRLKSDERNLKVTITKKGEALKEKAVRIPYKLSDCIDLDQEDAKTLFTLLRKFLSTI
jgi:DNA-binding MarR family transcriptional regulator